MKYEEMNKILVLYFPNLKQLIKSEMDTFECYSPGPHVLYGNILNPYIKMILEHEDDQAALQQIFSFYEELAISEDEEVRNLLQVTLLEALWDEKKTYTKACKYMQPMTKRINSMIYDYLSEPLE